MVTRTLWLAAPALLNPFGELRGVISEILTLIIQVTAVLLALAIATGFLEAQASYVFGAPSLLSALWFKVGSVILCHLIVLTAVSISNLADHSCYLVLVGNLTLTTWFAAMSLTIQPSHHHQIGGEHAPADPLLEAFKPVAWAASQLHRTLDDTDPSFNAIPETLTPLEPGLLFTPLPPSIPIAGLGQNDVANAHPPSERFILG